MRVFFERFKNTVWSFWFVIVLLALAAFYIAVYLYRLKFGGDLSGNAADWSSFGSYIGGIFGPLVSFLTLLVVLKTVYLQRELLDTQKNEFSELNRLQIIASEKQDEQIRHAKAESERARVQVYQTTQINSIESFISLHQRETDKLEAAIERILALEGPAAERVKAAESLSQRKKAAEKKVHSLIMLSLEISFKEYESVVDLKVAVGPRMLDILEGSTVG